MNEKELVLTLCKYKLNEEDKYNIQKKLNDNTTDWKSVMGLIITNRLVGHVWRNIVYYRFKCNNYTDLFKYLHMIYKAQKIRSDEQVEYITKLTNNLQELNIKYCILKGPPLSSLIYDDLGIRYSSDIDVLVRANELNSIIELLNNMNFKQGHYSFSKEKVIPAERKEKIMSTLTTHEIVPMVIKTNDSFLFNDYIEFDIQFSLDLMSPNRTNKRVNDLLDNSQILRIGNSKIRVPNIEDTFIFLCSHFYKEATNEFKKKKNRDSQLYKLVDIHHYINKFNQSINIQKIVDNVIENDIQEHISFTITHLVKFFPDENSNFFVEYLEKSEMKFS